MSEYYQSEYFVPFQLQNQFFTIQKPLKFALCVIWTLLVMEYIKAARIFANKVA